MKGLRVLPTALARRFEAAVFDWDGTAVPDRHADAARARRLVEALSAGGFHVGIVSGTHLGNVDGQLAARPPGPGALFLCLNRGSEVFAVGPDGPELVYRHVATKEEDAALTAAAEATIRELASHRLRAEIIFDRLNRRKIDLIPEPEWADPPKARIDELLAAVEDRLAEAGLGGLSEVAALAEAAAREAGLRDPRVTSDVKHVEIGLTDKSDSAHWLFAALTRLGIGPHAVLLGGDEFGPLGGLPGSDSLMLVPEAGPASAFSVGVEPGGLPPGVLALGGGPRAFMELLEDQLARRASGELPILEPDAGWTIEIEGLDPARERANEAVLTLADGLIGTTGAPLLAHESAAARVFVGGVYDGKGSVSRLLEGPIWSRLGSVLASGSALRRVLDLRAGTLYEEVQLPEGTLPVRSLRLSSTARPGTVALRVHGPRSVLRDHGGLVPPRSRAERSEGTRRARPWMQVRGTHGGVTAAIRDLVRSEDGSARFERLGAYVVGSDDAPAPGSAVAALGEAEEAGFDRLLCEHRATWGSFWEVADIRVERDPELQRAIRLALFQLSASVGEDGETALGARGLTGPGYRGHVFWDTDVFVLPFLAATRPRAARTLLEYRVRRLGAAFREAHASGRAGARFPWESARSGRDVTPDRARVAGETIPILTGQLEEHIVADVAWAVACYLDWTGDEEFASGAGRTILVETARYWASRITLDREGRGHIEGVIGPDEYHENVDDNAFTNGMARWNLRRAAVAASFAGGEVGEDEIAHWYSLAEALVDGYDPATGLYEQFDGFFELEPLLIAEIAEHRPADVEKLLGRARLAASQVGKQADTMMLHQLIPDEVAPGSLGANLLFYEPRTAHGSSLSPGVHAGLFARLGLMDEALEWLRLTSRIDLDDLTGTSVAGLHTAAMGSLWQALVFGFAGLRPAGEALRLDPRLPDAWGALELGVVFRGARVRVRAENPTVTVSSDRPVPILFQDRTRPVIATADGVRLRWKNPGRAPTG